MAAKPEKAAQSPVDKMINQDSVPDFKTIQIVLSYTGYDPMIFEFRRSLGPQLRALQREFFGKTPEQQLETQQAYRVSFLSDLIKKHPENVPDYPTDLGVKEAFVKYFEDIEMDDMVDHIWVAHQNKIYPKELTSTASE